MQHAITPNNIETACHVANAEQQLASLATTMLGNGANPLEIALEQNDQKAAALIAYTLHPQTLISEIKRLKSTYKKAWLQKDNSPQGYRQIYFHKKPVDFVVVDKIAHNYLQACQYWSQLQNDSYLEDILSIAHIGLYGVYKNTLGALPVPQDLRLLLAETMLYMDLRAAERFLKAINCRLILAVKKIDLDKVAALLKEGVNIDVKDWHGKTALDYALTPLKKGLSNGAKDWLGNKICTNSQIVEEQIEIAKILLSKLNIQTSDIVKDSHLFSPKSRLKHDSEEEASMHESALTPSTTPN